MAANLAADAAAQVSFLQSIWNYIVKLATDVLNYLPTLVVDLIICVLIWFLARFIIGRISKYTTGILNGTRKLKHQKTDDAKRAKSIATLTRSTLRYLIYFVAIMAILSVLGISDATTLLASAGIGSIAIGFGAQNLVKDVISGLFMVFENQYAVGDYVKMNATGGDIEGTVEAIAMRVTYIRNAFGQQYIVPNGTINMVVNCTRGDWLAVVDVPIAYEEDIRRACDVVLAAAKKCVAQMPDHAVAEPVVQGVTAFNDSMVTIRLVCRAKATMQWELERKLRLAVKEAFDDLGIEIPYSKMVVVPPKKCGDDAVKQKKIDEFIRRNAADSAAPADEALSRMDS